MKLTYRRVGTSSLLVIGALLIFLSGSARAIAQVSAPLPNTSQVISQHVESIPGGSVQWYIRYAEVPPVDSDPLVVANRFVYADEGQVLLSHDSGERMLVSNSQAAYASGSWQAVATTDQSEGVLTFQLIAESPPDEGIRSQPFAVDAGDYNLQMTRGVLQAGMTDIVQPGNDYPMLVVVTSGTVSFAGSNNSVVEEFRTGDVGEWVGAAEILANEDATYVILSIGDMLAPAPAETAVAPTAIATEPGETLVLFWDCAANAYPVENRDECALVWEPIAASFTMVSAGIPLTRTDATQFPDGSWIYEGMTSGEWEFQLYMADGSPPPTFTVLGDAVERDGVWHVTVSPGERSVANVMMYGRTGTSERSGLTITFMECPEGWTPAMDMATCVLATTEPTLRIEEVTGQEVVRFTQWDAVMPDIGTYAFDALPVGSYVLELEYNDLWTLESTYFLEQSYSDGLSWYVEVTAAAPANVLVVHAPVSISGDTITPPTVATGHVVITQEECESDAPDAACMPALEPWDVRLTNIETAEVWLMSEWGYNSADGQWIMQLPTGSYGIDVPDNRGWVIDFPGMVDVFNDQESYVTVRGNP